jgi:TPR repeat protein
MPPPPTPPTRAPATARRVADETNGHGVVVSASELLCRAGDRAFFGWGEPRSREKALNLYARAASDASSPCASAMRRLGRCYEEGAGVAPDLDAAASWNEAAAALGDPDATCATARVVERAGDLRGAGERYQFAADAGHAGAAFELGRMYANGLGVRKDAEAAAYWYQLAAEHGDAAAQRAVGVAGMEAANENEANDPAAAAAAAREAIEWLERAAAQGDADALNDLAIVHEDGHAIAAIPRDAEKARGLYSRAAERGHPRARNNLGFVYMASEAYADAAVHFRIAANEGDADAMNNLGNLVENGLGVPKDLREARWMYERAAAAGVDKAREAAARVSETIRRVLFSSHWFPYDPVGVVNAVS